MGKLVKFIPSVVIGIWRLCFFVGHDEIYYPSIGTLHQFFSIHLRTQADIKTGISFFFLRDDVAMFAVHLFQPHPFNVLLFWHRVI